MEPLEIIVVEETTVGCDGGLLGHPLVYLKLGETDEIDCPYCGRRFVLKSEAGALPGT